MSLWLDEKYVGLMGGRLPYFHKQSQHTYTFRCPICGDSQRRANRTRGYFYVLHQKYLYKCHNCNASLSLRSFLRDHAPDLHQEYLLDLIRQDRPLTSTPTPATTPMFGLTPSGIALPALSSLPATHPAVVYCQQRQLPAAALAHLHYTDDWASWMRGLKWDYTVPVDHHPRLVIPWYDRFGALHGAQVRRIDVTGHEGRYLTFKRDESSEKIYGWDRIDFHQRIYVVEGPLDAWFLPNAVAAMGSDLLRVHDQYCSTRMSVYVWDNEPRNRAVMRGIHTAIQRNLPVVIWPHTLVEKDLNDMAKAGYDVPALVAQHTYRGLRAELEFVRYKKS